MEIWKEIVGFEGLYWVSNFGRIKSKRKIRKICTSKCGYSVVNLSNSKTFKKFYIHRLVASAFINNPNNYNEINHKDENKTNNSVENLEWCDRNYNCTYGTKTERTSLKTSKPILEINLTTGLITYWKSSGEIKRILKKDTKNIRNCLKGKMKQSYGSRWLYA